MNYIPLQLRVAKCPAAALSTHAEMLQLLAEILDLLAHLTMQVEQQLLQHPTYASASPTTT